MVHIFLLINKIVLPIFKSPSYGVCSKNGEIKVCNCFFFKFHECWSF